MLREKRNVPRRSERLKARASNCESDDKESKNCTLSQSRGNQTDFPVEAPAPVRPAPVGQPSGLSWPRPGILSPPRGNIAPYYFPIPLARPPLRRTPVFSRTYTEYTLGSPNRISSTGTFTGTPRCNASGPRPGGKAGSGPSSYLAGVKRRLRSGFSRMTQAASECVDSFGGRTKQACCVALLLLFGLLCAWLALPMVTSFLAKMSAATEGKPALVSPVTQLEQQLEKLRLLLQDTTANLEGANMEQWLRLEKSVTAKLGNCEAFSRASVNSLKRSMEFFEARIKELEAFRLDSQRHADRERPMADRIPDFALETLGTTVIAARTSPTYRKDSLRVTFLGVPVWYPVDGPSTTIQGQSELLPGKCWAFPGHHGTLAIQLAYPVRIQYVTLDHLPRHKSPTGRLESAPKDFAVYGLVDASDQGSLLGHFTYNQQGEPTQTFAVSKGNETVFTAVELRVMSNWGQDKFTCLYRFRVHGELGNVNAAHKQ